MCTVIISIKMRWMQKQKSVLDSKAKRESIPPEVSRNHKFCVSYLHHEGNALNE